MHREIELKLELAPKDADRLRAVPPLALTPASQQHQRSAYFDTPRRKLRKAGFTLRVRRSGGRMIQTVKSSGNGAGLFERDEWEAPVRAMKPDLDAARCTPLADLLTSKTEDRLQLVATIEVDRTSWKITDADDLIEVTFDAGVVSAGEAHQPISELELELKQGSEKALFGLCERIGGQVPLRLGVLTKAERAVTVGDGKHDRVRKAPNVELRSGMSVADAFAAIVLSCLRHFRLNEALLVEQRMPEALHQLRVALRRLRSALILFRPVLRRSRRYRRLSNELRRCGRTLGDARNLDVLLTMIDCRFAAVDEVKRARELSYDRVIAMLGSRRFLGMMLGLVRWVLIGKWRRRPDATIPLQSFSDWRLETAWAKLSRQRMSLSRMTDRQRHRLRVRSKEFRYAIEFLRSINPKPKEQRKAFHAALEALQEDLGQLNDVAHAKRLAAANGCSLRALSPEQSPEAVLDKAEKEYSDLLAIGPYWRREAT